MYFCNSNKQDIIILKGKTTNTIKHAIIHHIHCYIRSYFCAISTLSVYLLYLYSFSAVQHYIPVKYLHFLCNVFIFSFQMRMSFIQSQKSTSYQYNNHFDQLRLIIIYLYIQATLFMFISLFFCLNLTILVVHHFVLCIFIFCFVSIMYRAPYA